VESKSRKTLYSIGGALLLLLLWQLLSTLGNSGFSLPPPHRVLSTLFRMFSRGESWLIVASSTSRIVLSILAATFAAILFAWCASRLRGFRFVMIPLVQVMKAVPIVSFILIAMFFMGETVLTLFISGLVVFPMIYNHLLSAFIHVDKKLLEMARVFAFRKREILRYIIIPQSREEFLAASSVAIGMAWKAGVAAEVLAFSKGTIGRHMYDAKLYLDMEKLLAWTLVLVAASFLVEKLIVGFSRLTLTWIGGKLPGPRMNKTPLPSRGNAGCQTDGKADGNGNEVKTIAIRGLSKQFDESAVFKDFNAVLRLDRPVILTGASGSGKTTLLRLIAGLEKPDEGTITGVPERGVFVFQDNRLLPQLSARDNIRIVLPGYDGNRADMLLEQLGLASVKNQPASTLSGGEQRRLALARALAPDSEILYLDEAFRELDEVSEEKSRALVCQIAGKIPMILSSHDHTLIGRLDASSMAISKCGSKTNSI